MMTGFPARGIGFRVTRTLGVSQPRGSAVGDPSKVGVPARQDVVTTKVRSRLPQGDNARMTVEER